MAQLSCDVGSPVTQSRWADLTGSHEAARPFPRHAAAHPREYDHEHARNPNNRVSQVSSSVRFSTSAGRKRGHRSAKGLCRYRPHILRDWFSTVYEKSWLDQGL